MNAFKLLIAILLFGFLLSFAKSRLAGGKGQKLGLALSPAAVGSTTKEMTAADGISFSAKIEGSDQNGLAMTVSLDNHRYDLSNFDFSQNLFLVGDDHREYKPESLTLSGSGHHVSARVVFPKVSTAKFTLKLLNLREVPERRLDFD